MVLNATTAMDRFSENTFRGLSKLPISPDRQKVFATYAELIWLQNIGNAEGEEDSWVAKDKRLNDAIEYAAPKGSGGILLQNIILEIPPTSRLRIPLINTLTLAPRMLAHNLKAYRAPSPLCGVWVTHVRKILKKEVTNPDPKAEERVKKMLRILGEE